MLDDFVRNSPSFKQLQRFRVKRAGTDLRVEFSIRFKDLGRNASAREGQRERETNRSCADDENGEVELHCFKKREQAPRLQNGENVIML